VKEKHLLFDLAFFHSVATGCNRYHIFAEPEDQTSAVDQRFVIIRKEFSLQTETPNRKLLWPIEAFSTSSPKGTGISGCSEFCTRYFVEYSAATVYLLPYPVYHLIIGQGVNKELDFWGHLLR
jgi:hypothetical protein